MNSHRVPGAQCCVDPQYQGMGAGALIWNELRLGGTAPEDLSYLGELGNPLNRRQAQQPVSRIEDVVSDRHSHV
jgi:hypothetical protein